MATYTLKIPDYDIDVGEFFEVTVNAESEAQARHEAAKVMPNVPWDVADCILAHDYRRAFKLPRK